MILDGADEIAIDKEMNKVETYLKVIQLDNSIWSVLDRVEFTEEEYKWAYAQYKAEQLIEDIKLSSSLNDKQKIQLLKLFRDSCLDEINGKEKKTNVMKKALKIVEEKRC